jgi:serine/threonine-protein kinase RsbW
MACNPRSDGIEGVDQRVIFAADLQSVRGFLADLVKADALKAMDDDRRSIAELVLAEVLNNIVEHAYASSSGKIEVTLQRSGKNLLCHVVDSGCPMPGGILPSGIGPAFCDADLPEGGFGWHLIRSLSHSMAYTREGGTNHLRFLLDADNSGDPGASLPNGQR